MKINKKLVPYINWDKLLYEKRLDIQMIEEYLINYIDWKQLFISEELPIEFLDKYFDQIQNYSNNFENGLWYLIRNQALTDWFILNHYGDLKNYFLNLKHYELQAYISRYTGNNYKIFKSIHDKQEIFK